MEAVAFAQTREAGPRTRWFIATGTAAASRCIKVNTQPPAGPNPACSQPSPLPPPWQQLPVLLPPLPPPRPRPVPRPGIDSEGPRRGGGGVGCACGRKCVWPGLSCGSALTLSSVIWPPPPAPGAAGLETFRGGGWRRGRGGGVRWCGGRGLCPGGRRGAACAPIGGVAVAVGLGLGTWRPLPLPWLLLSAAVCLETSCGMELGSGMPLAAPGRVAEAEGWPCRFRLGSAAAAPPSFLAETLLLRTRSFLRRRRWPSAAAVVLLQGWLAELSWAWWMRLFSGCIWPLPQLKGLERRGGSGAASDLGSILAYLRVFPFDEFLDITKKPRALVRVFWPLKFLSFSTSCDKETA